MRGNRFNLRNVVAVAICLVGLMAFVGCENKVNYYEYEDPIEDCENKDDCDKPVEEYSLVGKWITDGNDHNLIEDGRILEFGKSGWLGVADFFVTPADISHSYSLSENKITITTHLGFLDKDFYQTFEYVLNENSLTVKYFSRFLSWLEQEGTDVHFTRVE